MSAILLVGLLVMVALAGLDAWRDPTPMKPWSWSRPDLAWWAHRRTQHERARVEVSLGKDA